MSEERSFDDLVRLMARLRAPGGCPWDREQDSRSLRTFLLEETYEVLDAIERDDARALKEELGDLLLQVLFHAQIAREEGKFSIDDVLTGLHDKLIRRHPHVFGTTEVENSKQVVANWEALKAAERQAHESAEPADSSVLNGVPRALPAVLEAYQLTRRAALVGFDWGKADDVLTKLEEEAEELRGATTADDPGQLEEEVGDLLFVVINLARKLGQDPELALRRANRKFVSRFQDMERELAEHGRRLADATLDEMDALWEQAKQRESRS